MSDRGGHALLAVTVSLVLFAGAGTLHAGEKCRQVAARTSADYLEPGPYPVGHATFTFVDASRPTAASGSCAEEPSRTLVTEVWFPATSPGGAIVDASGGPYPLVVHSHGLLDYRTGEAHLAQHLASFGYVVASADFPRTNLSKLACIRLADIVEQPGDVSFVIDSVLAELGSAIDADRIGAAGLSFGGTTTLLVTYHAALRDPRIKAALPIAPGACMVTKAFFTTTDAPLLLLTGSSDVLVPWKQNAKRPYKAAGAPKYLVTLRDASHTSFTGILAGNSGTPHPDTIGCAAIDDVVPDEPGQDDPFAGLEGAGAGINSTPKRCPLPCTGAIPESAMAANRQHELSKIAYAAFFEGTLRDDVAARCFLRKTFAKEQDEVQVSAR
jgi:predicted dienelactone hydrolase